MLYKPTLKNSKN